LLDEQMLIDVDLQQNTRQILNRKGVDVEDIREMVQRFDRNGFSWAKLICGEEQQMERDEFIEGEIRVDQHFPQWFRAKNMHEYEMGIIDSRHPDSDEMFYKKLLENGTPILDVIKTIKPYTMMGNRIIFAGANNSINFQQGALIVIDNIQMGEDVSVLRTISPTQVESINISTEPSEIHKYTGLNVVGVIEITMKGYEPGSRLDAEVPRDRLIHDSYGEYIPGYPDYSIDKDQKSIRADYRRTIYWNPALKLNSEGQASFGFYTPDMKGRYIITIQGMLGAEPLTLQKEFVVK